MASTAQVRLSRAEIGKLRGALRQAERFGCGDFCGVGDGGDAVDAQIG